MPLARSLVRLLVRLPDRWLVRLAGGAPLVIEGRTLDPACQLLGVQAARRPQPEGVEATRRATDEGMALLSGDRVPGVTQPRSEAA